MDHTRSKDNTWLLLALAGIGIYWYMSKKTTAPAVPVTSSTNTDNNFVQPVLTTQPVYQAPEQSVEVISTPVTVDNTTTVIPSIDYSQTTGGGSLIENLSSSQYAFMDNLSQNYVANPQIDQAQL